MYVRAAFSVDWQLNAFALRHTYFSSNSIGSSIDKQTLESLHYNELWLKQKHDYQTLVAKQSLDFISQVSFIFNSQLESFNEKNSTKLYSPLVFCHSLSFSQGWFFSPFCTASQAKCQCYNDFYFISHSTKLLHPSSQSFPLPKISETLFHLSNDCSLFALLHSYFLSELCRIFAQTHIVYDFFLDIRLQ